MTNVIVEQVAKRFSFLFQTNKQTQYITWATPVEKLCVYLLLVQFDLHNKRLRHAIISADTVTVDSVFRSQQFQLQRNEISISLISPIYGVLNTKYNVHLRSNTGIRR